MAGKWQPDEGFIAGAWEAESFRDVYLPTRLHRISGRCLPALAWSAEGRFRNGQSRVVGILPVGCGGGVSPAREDKWGRETRTRSGFAGATSFYFLP
jgi:hypothetical protein